MLSSSAKLYGRVQVCVYVQETLRMCALLTNMIYLHTKEIFYFN